MLLLQGSSPHAFAILHEYLDEINGLIDIELEDTAGGRGKSGGARKSRRKRKRKRKRKRYSYRKKKVNNGKKKNKLLRKKTHKK